jgi:hypothetical protein
MADRSMERALVFWASLPVAASEEQWLDLYAASFREARAEVLEEIAQWHDRQETKCRNEASKARVNSYAMVMEAKADENATAAQYLRAIKETSNG